MKASHDVKATMIENGDQFTDPFFSRFVLRHAPQPLKLTDAVSKNYKFPTFYSDVTCAIGIFMCDYEKARKVLPDPRLKPVRMTKGRALVAFSCYEYKNVMGVLPYNEVSMMIPVLFDAPVDLPVLPMLAGSKYPGFGYYVFHMPVTSKENQIRGNKIWGLPKVTQDIDVRREGGDCVTTCFEDDGTPYFELRVPTAGAPAHFDVGADVVSRLDQRWLLSRTSFKSDFTINKYMGQLFKKGNAPDRKYLTIGDTPSARVLRDLDIEEHPFQFRYSKSMNAAFDLPHP